MEGCVKSFRIAVLTAVAVMATMLGAVSAQAQVVLGQVAPGGPPPALCGAAGVANFDLFQFGNANQETNYQVPEDGVITSWSTNAAAGAGQSLSFKVFRKVGPEQTQLVVAHNTQSLTPSVVNTFKVLIPVKVGDVIGLHTGNASPATPNACEFVTGEEVDETFLYEGNVADGATTGPSATTKGERVHANVSATFLAPPKLRTDTRGDLGSIAGGKTIVLTGFNFSEVTKVTVGGVPAKSFSAQSEAQLSVVVPSGKTLEPVAIAVTNTAGSGETPDVFSYQGCQVPRLTGKTLKVAKARLKAAGCALGRIKGKRRGKVKVVKQSPKAGALVAPGTKVNVKLRRR
jgi:hypothetical protein